MIPNEYLDLTLRQILILNHTPTPRGAKCSVPTITAAVTALERQIAARAADAARDDREWLAEQFAEMPTELPRPAS